MRNCSALHLSIFKYQPFSGSSYIKLPDEIEKKKAVVNVKNDDNRCFEWAILSALYPTDVHGERMSNYKKYLNTLDFTGITFPMQVTSIKRFQKLNPGIAVNVFGWNDGLYPLHIYEGEPRANYIELLLISEDLE